MALMKCKHSYATQRLKENKNKQMSYAKKSQNDIGTSSPMNEWLHNRLWLFWMPYLPTREKRVG